MRTLTLYIIIITCFSCSRTVNKDEVLILKLVAEELLDDKDALHFETLDKNTVDNILGNPVDSNLFLRTMIFPNSQVLYYFDQKTLSGFSKPLRSYDTIELNTLDIQAIPVVDEKDIPDYVRFQQPTPNWEVDFTNVYFLSTPLVYDNKAILFSHDFGSHGYDMHFFIKIEQKWSWLGKTSIYSIRTK